MTEKEMPQTLERRGRRPDWQTLSVADLHFTSAILTFNSCNELLSNKFIDRLCPTTSSHANPTHQPCLNTFFPIEKWGKDACSSLRECRSRNDKRIKQIFWPDKREASGIGAAAKPNSECKIRSWVQHPVKIEFSAAAGNGSRLLRGISCLVLLLLQTELGAFLSAPLPFPPLNTLFSSPLPPEVLCAPGSSVQATAKFCSGTLLSVYKSTLWFFQVAQGL